MLRISFRRGTAAQNDAYTGALGSLSIDDDTWQVRLHDGVSVGGFKLALQQSLTAIQDQIDALGIENISGLNTALAAKITATELGIANGVAGLNPQGVVPTEQLPSYVEDIVEVTDFVSLPGTGEIGKLYLTTDVNELYRWSGGQQTYYRITAVLESTEDLSEGQVNLYFTEQRVRDSLSVSGDLNYDPQTGVLSFTESVNSVNGYTGAVVLGKGDVGLDQVQNYGIASQNQAEEATESNVYLTALRARNLIEAMGFSDSEGTWRFDIEPMPVNIIGNFVQMTSSPTGLSSAASAVVNNKLYTFGGDSASGVTVKLLLEYDPSVDQWTDLTDVGGPSSRSAAAAIGVGEYVYVQGGYKSTTSYNDFWRYNTVSQTWTQLASLTSYGRYGHSMTSDGTYIYVLAGASRDAGSTYDSDKLYRYDPSTDSWVTLTDRPIYFRYGTCEYHDGKLYTLGAGGSISYQLWIYDIATDSWALGANCPRYAIYHAAAFLAGKMYIYGGRDATNNPTDQLHAYNVELDGWENYGNSGIDVWRHTLDALEDSLLTFGGEGYLPDLYRIT